MDIRKARVIYILNFFTLLGLSFYPGGHNPKISLLHVKRQRVKQPILINSLIGVVVGGPLQGNFQPQSLLSFVAIKTSTH